MKVQLKKLSEQVVVITGATSGIGLKTARMAARRGAKVVLAARNDEALMQLVDEIREMGSEALAVPTDVTRKQDVSDLADAAVERFGDFDTWVNGAGGSIYGLIRNVPVEQERKALRPELLGCRLRLARGGGLYAADAAAPSSTSGAWRPTAAFRCKPRIPRRNTRSRPSRTHCA